MQNKKYFLKILILSLLNFSNFKPLEAVMGLGSGDEISEWLEAKDLKSAIKAGDVQKFEKIMKYFNSNYVFFRWGSKNVHLIVYIIQKGNPQILESFLKIYKKKHFSFPWIPGLIRACNSNNRDDLLILVLTHVSGGAQQICDYSLKEFVAPIFENDKIDLFRVSIENYWVDRNSTFYDGLSNKLNAKLNLSMKRYNLLSYAISYGAFKIVKYLLNPNNIYVQHVNINDYSITVFKKDTPETFNNVILAGMVCNKRMRKLVWSHPRADFREAVLWLENNPEFREYLPEEVILDLKNRSDLQLRNVIASVAQLSSLPKKFNPKTKDNNGNNILHLALENENYDLFRNTRKSNPQLLTRFNLSSQTPQDLLSQQYIDAVKNKKLKALKKLMVNTPFVDVKDGNGDTLLHHAIRAGFKQAIALILCFLVKHDKELVTVRNNQDLYLAGFAISLGVNQAKSDPNNVDWTILKFLVGLAYAE